MTLALALLASTRADAMPPPPRRDRPGTQALTVLLGANTAFDGDPATFRLTLQGEADLAGGRDARLALAVPVTWMTSGDRAFGVSLSSSVFEIPPSLRLRLLPRFVIRPYADLGLGLAIASTTREGWLFAESDRSVGWMTRAALGVEIGSRRGLFLSLEPVSMDTYHLGIDATRVGGMIGVGSRF